MRKRKHTQVDVLLFLMTRSRPHFSRAPLDMGHVANAPVDRHGKILYLFMYSFRHNLYSQDKFYWTLKPVICTHEYVHKCKRLQINIFSPMSRRMACERNVNIPHKHNALPFDLHNNLYLAAPLRLGRKAIGSFGLRRFIVPELASSLSRVRFECCELCIFFYARSSTVKEFFLPFSTCLFEWKEKKKPERATRNRNANGWWWVGGVCLGACGSGST